MRLKDANSSKMNGYIELEDYSASNYAKTLVGGFNEKDWRLKVLESKYLQEVL